MTTFAFATDGRGAARVSVQESLLPARLARLIWIAPVLVALVVTTVYPTLFLLALAFSKSTLGKPFRGLVGVRHFAAALQDPIFLSAIGRSVAYALSTSLIQLAFGFLIALIFTSLLKAGRFLMSLVLLPLMTPPVMVGIAWKLIFAPAGGLINGTLLNAGVISEPISFLGHPTLAWLAIGVADLWQWTPFIVILCFAALSTIPEGVQEAALVDGANGWQRFWHITLPLVAAPLSSIYLLKLILSFKLFDLVYILTFGGPGFATTSAGFSIYRRAIEQFDVGRAAAETMIYAIVIGLATLPVVRLHQRLERRDT
ncbi:sugar ABC transporter permease [Ensifer sp.]|jgi:multiple sugar transport system permease protein|uniref:carbohydrate ABC transporter permease n=1 Tax=Ensifer sp. TaxID=1872086 RepID=UPI002E13D263|nr:sugar ABC transporter permease [Ensifer sp.]